MDELDESSVCFPIIKESCDEGQLEIWLKPCASARRNEGVIAERPGKEIYQGPETSAGFLHLHAFKGQTLGARTEALTVCWEGGI